MMRSIPPAARLLLAGIALLAACDLPTAATFPEDDLVALEPPPQFAYWWSLVEQCSGRTSSLATVRWFTTRSGPVMVEGTSYDGYWWRDGNRVAVGNPDDGRTVRHEMLHALLDRGDHPLDMFAGRCAGVVGFRTAPESHGVPPLFGARARTVPAESALVVTIARDPVAPSRSERGGWFTYVVTARNTTGAPVWVPLHGYTAAYYVREEGLAGTYEETRAARVFFLPGQERRVVLDARVPWLDTVHVQGAYGRAQSDWLAVTFTP